MSVTELITNRTVRNDLKMIGVLVQTKDELISFNDAGFEIGRIKNEFNFVQYDNTIVLISNQKQIELRNSNLELIRAFSADDFWIYRALRNRHLPIDEFEYNAMDYSNFIQDKTISENKAVEIKNCVANSFNFKIIEIFTQYAEGILFSPTVLSKIHGKLLLQIDLDRKNLSRKNVYDHFGMIVRNFCSDGG